MEIVLNEVEKAIKHEMYYLAVVMALTLPDICSALQSGNGLSTGEKYKEWYRNYLSQKYPRLTDSDCWHLRCGVVHQGRCGHPNMQYSRVIFSVPNPQNNIFHNNILNDALNLDAVQFCHDIMEAVREWFKQNHTNPTVQLNIPHMVQYRPAGMAPYIVGMPVISLKMAPPVRSNFTL